MTQRGGMQIEELRVDPARAALLVVDIQDRLAAAMPEADRAVVERNVALLVEAARRLNMPVVVSQQYPKGLGPTTPAIESSLSAGPLDLHRFDKVEFACPAAPPFEGLYGQLHRDQWIVTGMETHVCVYQTARALRIRGAQVHVPQDAVASRSPENREVGLRLIERTGALVTSTETVVFDALGQAGTEEFKALSKLIK